jgi:hypothetical protein
MATGGGAGGAGGAVATGGGAGGAAGAGGGVAPGCEVCTKAQDCCNAVNGGPLCTYNAGVCSNLPSDEQPYYANDCLQLIVATTGAWRGSPPPACR